MNTLSRWDAELYARNSAAQESWADELIGRMGLTGDETILDIGCGDGKITAKLASLVPDGKVVGIDLSPEMIALACKSYPPERFPSLRFRRMDAVDIRLDASFDVVFSNATLHWVPDHRAILRGVTSVLSTDGRVVVQMGGEGNAQDMLEALGHVMAEAKWSMYFRDFVSPYTFYGIDDYRTLLTEAGLDPVRIELFPRAMKHAGRDGLYEWLVTTWFPFTDRLPEKDRKPFLDQTVDRYLERFPPDSEGTVTVTMSRLEVEARLQTPTRGR